MQLGDHAAVSADVVALKDPDHQQHHKNGRDECRRSQEAVIEPKLLKALPEFACQHLPRKQCLAFLA